MKKNQLLTEKFQELKADYQSYRSAMDSGEVHLADTEQSSLKSKTGDSYLIKVKLPRVYNPDKQYPVLYVIDAETNFGGVSYISQRLMKDHLIPEILIVGIAYNTDYENFYRLRARDLTPTSDTSFWQAPLTGKAEQFSRFIETELFPYIAKNYRIDESDRAIYGHSFGGLFGTYLLLKKPDLFNRYLILSPSLWWDSGYLLKSAQTNPLRLKNERFYMGSGELERRIAIDHKQFIGIILERQPDLNNYRSEILDNETHRSIFGRAFSNGLRFIYLN